MDVDTNFILAESWDSKMPERLAWLRENEPVYWSEKTRLWMITRYEDVVAVSKDQDVFTSAEGVRPQTDTIIGLIDEPEPRHQQLRNLINKGFTPRMVKKLEKQFLEITTEAIDAIAAKGECDFVQSISVPLPIRLIASMIGIRDADRDLFHHWSDDLIAADGNRDNPEIMAKSAKAFVEYSQYVTKIIEERRANPEDDLVSILTGADSEGLLKKDFQEDGRVDREQRRQQAIEHGFEEFADLGNDELIMLLVILMVAGNETTRNGLSGGMQLLIENPDERRKLVDDPSLIPGAVEEMVRLTSPVRTFGRKVTRDTELRDRQLEAGQEVLLLYPSANRVAR